MTYSIEIWKESGVWCALTPDKDIFRNSDLAQVVGQIFDRVTSAIQYVPHFMRNASIEETGKFMIEQGFDYRVFITYKGAENQLTPQTNPSHPLNLYESLVTGTR